MGKFVNESLEECLRIVEEADKKKKRAIFHYTTSKIGLREPFIEDFENCLKWCVHTDELEFQEEEIESRKDYEARNKKDNDKREAIQKKAKKLNK